LRFIFDSTKDGYLYLVGSDSKHGKTVYEPSLPEQPLHVNKGIKQLVKDAVELDGILGEERFALMVCSKRLSKDQLAQDIQAIQGIDSKNCERVDVAVKKVKDAKKGP
jgi:hypothetical protein